ncbi:hypothetical protein [Saccharothrix xinjiangensis]|uniref:Novel STAND NTPase 1 domain-containing protein n=1 Tax=Saccharothrix xinjiangensis TaxID=204798 RepID=A0ABV9Y3U4_9PSEU
MAAWRRKKAEPSDQEAQGASRPGTGEVVSNSVHNVIGNVLQARDVIVQGDLIMSGAPVGKRRSSQGEREALGRTVERHRRRNGATRPRFMAVHPAVQVLVGWLAADSRQVLVVHGRAGSGKSSVVADAVTELIEAGWTAGVVRMDAIRQVSASAEELGGSCGLPDSPVVVVDETAGDARRVVVVDQLDAVSTYSGRMPDSYDAVAEMLEEAERHPQVKIVLVVRTVDLEADPRMRSLLSDESRVGSMEIADLEATAVKAALQAGGVDVASIQPPTLELLRLPLHLAVFSRLSSKSQRLTYRTLPDLYEQFTTQTRQAVETELGGLDWATITTTLVSHMSDNEVLQVPTAVLDEVPRRQVSALASAGVLLDDTVTISFCHETYFDFMFARAFVARGENLHEFLVRSGQHLFRRAQTRQVLEHLAGTDRRAFHATVGELLASTTVRSHLLDVVVGVLGGIDADGDDWSALEPLAFGGSRRSGKLTGLLSSARWFDAADRAGRWEVMLRDPDRVGAANQLVIAARERPKRVAELVRPHIGTSQEWNNRLRSMVEWSLTPGLVDLTVELAEQGLLDHARGPIAINSDFWSILYGLKDDEPRGAARIIGAHLRRAQVRAQEDGSPDPFASGHLKSGSSGGASTVIDIAEAAPEQFLVEVLPFLVAVIQATGFRDDPEELLVSPRWRYRVIESNPQIDSALFTGVEKALCATASRMVTAEDNAIRTLAGSDLEALRFLACRAYTAGAEQAADEAVDWLLSDPRNLRLGWSDSPRWATRQLVEAASRHCDDDHLAALCRMLLQYYPPWETTVHGRSAHGYSQYQLLTAIDRERLLPDCARRIAELKRRFPHDPPTAPQPMMAHFVGPPVPEKASGFMTDQDWLRAIGKYHDNTRNYSTTAAVGGVLELARMLGRAAQVEPERFTRLALTFDADIPAHHIVHVVEAVAGKIPTPLLSELCAHAHLVAGPAAGRAVCRAIQANPGDIDEVLLGLLAHYSQDSDPERETARTASRPGQWYYNGDLHTAGMNCTRGAVAETIGQVLFARPEFGNRLLPTVARLANDPIMAVRTQTTEAVLALFNTHPEEALNLANQLLSEPKIDIFDSDPATHLLTSVALLEPQRFAGHLARALAGPEAIAERAGHVWANALGNDRLDPSIPADPDMLAVAARRGAATTLATAPGVRPDLMTRFFNDSDATVREAAAAAVTSLDQTDTATTQTLVTAFTTSAAFTEHFDNLFRALEDSLALLPEAILDACDRAIDIAGGDLGDIRTATAAVSHDMVTIVLRLYRQGHDDVRSRCLDVIDRMSDLNASGLFGDFTWER